MSEWVILGNISDITPVKTLMYEADTSRTGLSTTPSIKSGIAVGYIDWQLVVIPRQIYHRGSALNQSTRFLRQYIDCTP